MAVIWLKVGKKDNEIDIIGPKKYKEFKILSRKFELFMDSLSK